MPSKIFLRRDLQLGEEGLEDRASEVAPLWEVVAHRRRCHIRRPSDREVRGTSETALGVDREGRCDDPVPHLGLRRGSTSESVWARHARADLQFLLTTIVR